MNGLSLRVSSIANCNSIKRNYECKQEKVEIKFKCDFKEKGKVFCYFFLTSML